MRSPNFVLTAALFFVPLAVSLAMGYVDGDLRWGLINGAIIGAIFALAGLLGVFE